jgi:hypothetical protein
MDAEPFYTAGRILTQLKDNPWTSRPLQGIDLIFQPFGKPFTLFSMISTLSERKYWRGDNTLEFGSLLEKSRKAQSSDPRIGYMLLLG